MRLSLSAILFSAALLAPVAAAAADEPPATLQQASATSNTRVCRQVFFEGLMHRECHTLREWNSMRSDGQRQLKEYQARELLFPHM